jgi:hypothetical protein
LTQDNEAAVASKPGILTTEFWAQLVAQIINLLVGLNLLSPADVPSVETTVSKIIAVTFLIASNTLVVIHYINGRLALKRAAVAQSGKSMIIPSAVPALAAIVTALALAGSTYAAPPIQWPANWHLPLPWRTKINKDLQDIKGQILDHEIKLATPPKTAPTGEQPQRLSSWEPALYTAPLPQTITLPKPLPRERTP